MSSSGGSPPPAASIKMGEGEPWGLLPWPGFPLLSRVGTPVPSWMCSQHVLHLLGQRTDCSASISPF